MINLNYIIYKSRLIVGSIIALMLFSNIHYLYAEDVHIYGPNENPYGKTFEEYSQIFWNNWVNLDPIKSSSSKEYQHPQCFVMEIDKKLFLQDFYAELKSNRDRSFDCTIPKLPIVIPALIEGCSYGDYKDISDRNDNKLIECAHSHNPYAFVEVKVNGQSIKNINDYRKTSDFFLLNVTNPENAYEIEPGTWRAIMDSIIIVLDLPLGEHEITYSVLQKLPQIIAPDDFLLKTNVKYHFTVVPETQVTNITSSNSNLTVT